MKRIIIAIFIPFIFASYSYSGDKVWIHNGFIKGNKYNKFSDSEQRLYLMGVIDGFMFAPIFAKKKMNIKWFTDCVEGMEDFQVEAIVEKYLIENPIQWTQSMHTIIYNSFIRVCPNSPFKK